MKKLPEVFSFPAGDYLCEEASSPISSNPIKLGSYFFGALLYTHYGVMTDASFV